MTRNRCTALCAALHLQTDRGSELQGLEHGAYEHKRGRSRAREVQIRDGIKHCETERVNEKELRKTEGKQFAKTFTEYITERRKRK